MDFHLDEELLDLQGLAREILADRATTDRVREVESTMSRVDEPLWAEFAKAGLLGVALPEHHGGAGLGIPGLCVLLQEQGRHVAPLPLWPAALAAVTLAVHGNEEQQGHLSRFVEGDQRMTLALEEFDDAEPAAPRCRAELDGQQWRLDGLKAVVPSAYAASHVLVSATSPAGPAVFLVAADADGVTWEATHTTTHDRAGNLTLAGAAAEPVGEPGTGVLEWLLDRSVVAVAALQVGVAEGALRLAATYTSDRHQFGRPLATFQSLQHQLADCYIDIEAMRVTLWQAVTSLETGDGPVGAVQVAKWWADQAGLDVVHRALHVHGGIGVDVDYPVHRHFLWGKQLASTLGGAAPALEELGAVLAREEVAS